MRTVMLAAEDDFEGWRDAARSLVLGGITPDQIIWQVGERPVDLFGDEAVVEHRAGPGFSVPRPFVELAQSVVRHADPARFALLYDLLWRLRRAPGLIADHADPLVRRLEEMAKAVRRDMHKMRAFVRFREVTEDGAPRFVAWFEPEHHIVRANAGFFVRRFAAMRWSILTPEVSIHWDGETLREGLPATRGDAPAGDPVEEVWRTYYASIFNPARVKVGAMLKEMPRKYWKNMPETALVPELIATAQARETGMIETAQRKAAAAPASGNIAKAWAALREEAAGCTRCDLYRQATQTVFGEGPLDASLMFVGEQPGDQEDLAGKPFVGPAGKVFDDALAQAGVDRTRVYVTNAVKHFKFEQRGKRRIHAKPQGPEIEACRWWMDQERALIRPPVTVALGVTAARSLFGKTVTIAATRGRPHVLADGGECWVTVHPSFLLRLPDRSQAEEEFARFVADLKEAAARVSVLAE